MKAFYLFGRSVSSHAPYFIYHAMQCALQIILFELRDRDAINQCSMSLIAGTFRHFASTTTAGCFDPMAISDHFGAGDAQTPMLESAVVNGAVDYKGRQASRLNSGRWRSAGFIIGTCDESKCLVRTSC